MANVAYFDLKGKENFSKMHRAVPTLNTLEPLGDRRCWGGGGGDGDGYDKTGRLIPTVDGTLWTTF